MKGPDYKASGRTKILFLLQDYQEGVSGPAVIDMMSAFEVWELISEAFWEEILSIPLIRVEAQRIGFLPIKVERKKMVFLKKEILKKAINTLE